MKDIYVNHIAQQMQVKAWQVENCALMFEQGDTIPFISRYRKERTGGLDDASVAEIKHWVDLYQDMEKRKSTILDTIASQDKLTDELKSAIENCVIPAQLEDLYLPYRPKRRTRATAAKEAGLEPLADVMYAARTRNPQAEAQKYVGDKVPGVEEALAGARDIIAERLSETAVVRENLRQIPFDMDGCRWYLQYSPYVYYNEHCIAFSGKHTPMVIDAHAFRQLLDFVTIFPHYFMGSNADLPIVGGSIFTHAHFQGGHYTFPMEVSPVEEVLTFRGFDDVQAGIVKWPMSVIRLRGAEKERLARLADKILRLWRGYTDEAAAIYAETDGIPHNTITPIARRRGADYEFDLVLRNNLTTDEYPLGLYHPHAELHHIKKENIGLIEVMGLAVLPPRLKPELARVRELILSGGDLRADPLTEKHADWAEALKTRYAFTPENAEEILRREVGVVFAKVLEHAGVYKRDEAGKAAFRRFIDCVNQED